VYQHMHRNNDRDEAYHRLLVPVLHRLGDADHDERGSGEPAES
jgi:hypothetical protein